MHPKPHKLSAEQAFFQADHKARKQAGLMGRAGAYQFSCPNCGTICKGTWLWNADSNSLHGHTGCPQCGIHLWI